MKIAWEIWYIHPHNGEKESEIVYTKGEEPNYSPYMRCKRRTDLDKK